MNLNENPNGAVENQRVPIRMSFADSVNGLSAKDIDSPVVNKRKQRSKLEKILTDIVFIVCIAVFCVCLYKVADNLIGKYIGENLYNDIVNDFFDTINGDKTEPDNGANLSYLPISSPSVPLDDYKTLLDNSGNNNHNPNKNEISSQLAAIRAKIAAMRLKNDEIFGVIKVTGTNIAYTLVRHDDNDYYLNHSTEKKPLVIGSIFLDYRNSTLLGDNRNSILYGHNMTSGSMFHDLELFENNEALFRDSKIYIYTNEGIYVYKPFSFYRTNLRSDYIRTSFSSGSEYVEWAKNVKARSVFETDTEISDDDLILTLSTCINFSYNNEGRFSLHAILTEIIKD